MATSPPPQSSLWLRHQDPPRLWPTILTISSLMHLGLFSIIYPLVIHVSQSQTSGANPIPIELIDLGTETTALSPEMVDSTVERTTEGNASSIKRSPENSTSLTTEETIPPQRIPPVPQSPISPSSPRLSTTVRSNPPPRSTYDGDNFSPSPPSNPLSSTEDSLTSPNDKNLPTAPNPNPSTQVAPQASEAPPISPELDSEPSTPSQPTQTSPPVTNSLPPSQPTQTPSPPVTESVPTPPPTSVPTPPPTSIPTPPPTNEALPPTPPEANRNEDSLGTLSAVIQNPRSSVRVQSSGDVMVETAYDPARPLFTTKNFTLNNEQNACSVNLLELERYLGQPVEIEVSIVHKIDEVGRLSVEVPFALPLEPTPTVYDKLAACLIQQWEFAPARLSGEPIDDSLIIEMTLFRGE